MDVKKEDKLLSPNVLAAMTLAFFVSLIGGGFLVALFVWWVERR